MTTRAPKSGIVDRWERWNKLQAEFNAKKVRIDLGEGEEDFVYSAQNARMKLAARRLHLKRCQDGVRKMKRHIAAYRLFLKNNA